MPNYKFREDELIAEFTKYIDQTYGGHYGQGGLQSSEVIVDRGHALIVVMVLDSFLVMLTSTMVDMVRRVNPQTTAKIL
jgi:hypothetical protein